MVIDLVAATKLIGPGMARTALAQLRKKKPGADDDEDGQPGDEEVYQQSLRLMRKVMELVCTSRIEDLHVITDQHTPPPPWVLVRDVEVPDKFYSKAATLIQRQLAYTGNLEKVGKSWWQWRKLGSTVRAQWVEMRVDYEERIARNDPGKKVIFYIHGGAYYLGGIAHDVQIQRHARKLKGRCFAPRYRLAPQFPFPCPLQDLLSAYLYLLTRVEPSHVILAGDSAGGGLCLALLQIIRDQGLPMPAGASLISPWVDLMHTFPSILRRDNQDYVPSFGFHAKPSLAWPPPTADEMRILGMERNTSFGSDYTIDVGGQPFTITEQINMYAPNLQLVLALCSPIYAATLGGFCPVQMITGDGELLRDEQLFLAHKMASPTEFPLAKSLADRNGEKQADINKYPPTDVQLLIFDDGPHAAPMLGHIDVAKHQYRAISSFAAWALSEAQDAEIEIEDFVDDCPSPAAMPAVPQRTYSVDGMNDQLANHADRKLRGRSQSSYATASASGVTGKAPVEKLYVGLRAGDQLPPFEKHMMRYRVDRRGRLYPAEAPELMPALRNRPRKQVGYPKGETLAGWIKYKEKADIRFAAEKKKIFEKRLALVQKGFIRVPGGEIPPPSALVGRRAVGAAPEVAGATTGLGNSILSKLFSTLGKGGPAAESQKDNTDGSVSSAKRSSRVIRPADYGPPAAPRKPHRPAREESGLSTPPGVYELDSTPASADVSPIDERK